MHEPEWSTYPFSSISEAFKRVVNMNRKYNMIISDYFNVWNNLKQFWKNTSVKTYWDIMQRNYRSLGTR